MDYAFPQDPEFLLGLRGISLRGNPIYPPFEHFSKAQFSFERIY